MQRSDFKEYSAALNREMPFTVYGRSGVPIIVFPTQNGRCHDYEDNGMVDALSSHIEEGRLQLFCVDSVDSESWSSQNPDKGHRSWVLEQWFYYITQEFYGRVREINASGRMPVTTGCSMGATHALNMFLRRPDLFAGTIALSGAYDARYFFGDWSDENLYRNNIIEYMSGMSADHPYIKIYNKRTIIVCTGQGAWEDEMRRTTAILRDVFSRKGIRAWFDFWGYDVNHDWPWWRKQIAYFIEHVLD